MALSLKQFYTRVQSYISDDSAGTLAVLKETINLKARELLRKGFFPWLLREKTLTLTAGTTDYVLPYDFGKPISIRQTNTPIQLRELWVGSFDRALPDPSNSTGDPTHFMIAYQNNVLAQPSTADKVVGYQSYSQPTKTITIYGVADGVDRMEVLTLSAAAEVSSTNSYSKLYSISIDDSPEDSVYFRELTAATELLVLYPNNVSLEYKTIRFYPKPTQANSIYLKYQAMQPWLVNDSDLFIIPNDFTDVLFHMVVEDHLAKQGDSKAAYHAQKAQAGISELLKGPDMQWDYTPQVQYGSDAVVDQNYPFVNS